MFNKWKGSEFHYFRNLAATVGVSAIDVGSRNLIKSDLARLSESIQWLALDPDKAGKPKNAGSNIHFVPMAASDNDKGFRLNLYRQRGCSSAYDADIRLAKRYSREDYYELDDVIDVSCATLDNIVSEHLVESPAFLKLDIQGMEELCLIGAQNILSEALVGVRIEVSYIPIYQNQPIIGDIDKILQAKRLQPVEWLESHSWRRDTKTRLPKLAAGKLPYSKGQLIHGDLLYLIPPEELEAVSPPSIKRLVRLGLIAVCFDHLDIAVEAFARPEVREMCIKATGDDPVEAVQKLSRYLAKLYNSPLWKLKKAVERYGPKAGLRVTAKSDV